jgi:cytochrome c oxidase subunit 2
VGRFWSILFLLVPIFGVGTFVAAPFIDHWLPSDVSAHGRQIDHLFSFCLWLTGAVFVATEAALFWFLWKYDGGKNPEAPKFTHGSHSLELVWTLLPAATLLFIAIYQINAWADVKINKPDIPPIVEVTARQFGWSMRYPYTPRYVYERDEHGHIKTDAAGKRVKKLDAAGKPQVERDKVTGRAIYDYGESDVYAEADLHLPVDEEILLDLKSKDVLHSFFLPNLRVKQDAVPGSTIPVWFRAKKTGTYDLVCAELCGWGHYKMKGRLTVESREDFDKWLDKMKKEQDATTEDKATTADKATTEQEATK